MTLSKARPVLEADKSTRASSPASLGSAQSLDDTRPAAPAAESRRVARSTQSHHHVEGTSQHTAHDDEGHRKLTDAQRIRLRNIRRLWIELSDHADLLEGLISTSVQHLYTCIPPREVRSPGHRSCDATRRARLSSALRLATRCVFPASRLSFYRPRLLTVVIRLDSIFFSAPSSSPHSQAYTCFYSLTGIRRTCRCSQFRMLLYFIMSHSHANCGIIITFALMPYGLVQTSTLATMATVASARAYMLENSSPFYKLWAPARPLPDVHCM